MNQTVIKVTDIAKRYGDTIAVDGISFEVQEGEIFGLLGPNGAGKTTTMECVEGIRKLDGGTVSVFDLDPIRDAVALSERIGVQLQEAQLQKRIKVGEAVSLWASIYANSVDGSALLEQLGLEGKRDTWFMNLSGGQKQRLFIALSLINDPDIVFLDELTTGLDPQARRTIWDLVLEIKDRDKTVFLTTHLMEEAERLCDRVAIIEHGKIIALDTPTNLVTEHCPERSVVFSIDGDVELSRFENIDGLSSANQKNDEIRLVGLGDTFVSNVIHAIADQNINVLNFRTEIPTLEEVFLKLTGHGIRE
ncbi:MAG: ABC transporter ATP-binding protein [Candidatus Hydrogenedentota bacterium]